LPGCSGGFGSTVHCVGVGANSVVPLNFSERISRADSDAPLASLSWT
jgi:hypothetical protein